MLVLGMHRSGTSALAGVIAALGAKSAEHPIPASDDNPKGFFESESIVKIHDRMLSEIGSHWFDWCEINSHLCDVSEAYRQELTAAARQEFGESPTFVVKDPRICRFVPLWLEVAEDLCADIIAVHIFRNPIEVAASLQARNDLNEFLSCLVWLRHNIDAERSTRHLPRYFLNFAGLAQDPLAEMKSLFQALRIDRENDSRAALDVTSFVDSRLKRQNCTSPAALHALGAWIDAALKASYRLRLDAYDSVAMAILDSIRGQLDAAACLFGPALVAIDGHVARLEQRAAEADRVQSERAALVQALDVVGRTADRVPQLEGDLSSTQSRVGEMMQALSAAEAREKQLLEENKYLQIEADEAKNVEALRSKLASSEQDLAAARVVAALVPNLRADYESLTSRLTVADARLAGMSERCRTLAAYETQVRDLELKLKSRNFLLRYLLASCLPRRFRETS